ncbi:MAG: GNAT family N-acetyltransferase [Gemmatimonadales bacterium]|nr:GNAT family N-acetyltransferase [Gemmatimonadales bacterium]MDQ3426328.1 GNAT family N-acetyltransferase [Gemmatimonadota bacterium]
MKTVYLLPITPALVEALRTPPTFEGIYRLQLGAHGDLVREVVAANERMRQETGAPPEWGGHLAVDPETRSVVGTCAYKSAPDAEAGVEIAYFTFPEFERQGYGTAMASALLEQTMLSGVVRVVRAHTLPAPNASTRILERHGFTRTETVVDPDDGPVWRWSRPMTR